MQSADVLPCTLLDTDWAAFRLPSLEELLQYRVVVCTCIAASVMLLRYDTQVDCSPVVFTHALIDEAGQSPYPELIPLLLLPPDGGSCLAGALPPTPLLCSRADGAYTTACTVPQILFSLHTYVELKRRSGLMQN